MAGADRSPTQIAPYGVACNIHASPWRVEVRSGGAEGREQDVTPLRAQTERNSTMTRGSTPPRRAGAKPLDSEAEGP